MARYSFRKIAPDDAALFKSWLAQPHIAGWWEDGETEWALVAEDLDNPAIDMRIVQTDGAPMGFIQDYGVDAWPLPQYSDLPTTARAVDMFLGDPAYLGKGHAKGFIAARLSELNCPLVVTDPDPANTRAIATYAAAGFRRDKIATCEDGDPVQIMHFP